jgi:hypothetical protein
MNRSRAPSLSLVAAALAAALSAPASPGQAIPDLIAALARPDQRPRALAGLARLGAPAAEALVDAALAASRRDARAATVLSQALADLGRGTSAVVGRLVKALPEQPPQVRDALLHALGNGVLDCSEADLDALVAALPDWSRRGLFYSARADAPTFAWYEYVRLRKRIELRAGGLGTDALLDALNRIHRERSAIASMVGDTPADQFCNLGRFGQHGTRESIEAIAELALDAKAARPLARELAEYLHHEAPRDGEIVNEPCAGYGVAAPADRPEVKLPTRWRRDDWRFAVARAVLAHDDDVAHRQHALRHLLHAPSAAERLQALARVRNWPRPWTAFGPDLAALLDAPERAVVRDALVMLGLDASAARSAVEPLRRLAAGADSELAERARAILDGKR